MDKKGRNVSMEVQVKKGREIKIVGLKVSVKTGANSGFNEITKLWDEFMERIEEVKSRTNEYVTYGIVFLKENFQEGDDFTYLVGVEVDNFKRIPSGMIYKRLPRGQYAVIEYKGSIHQKGDVYDYYYNKWLPSVAYKAPKSLYEIERYDSRIFLGNEHPESQIRFLFPIESFR
jgi:AraC family transcriptional regulator